MNQPTSPTPLAAGTPCKTEDVPINILIVDDRPANLAVLESVLDDPRYRLIRADSAQSALARLLEQEFALFILDIRMPGISGLELAEMIRQRKPDDHVPIIFLSAHSREEQDLLDGYSAGAVDYIVKPFNPAIMRYKVAVFADLYRKTHQLEAANLALLSEAGARLQAEASLLERSDDLVAVNHELEAFCATVSHDLRAPIRAVNGFAEMALQEHPDLAAPVRNYLISIAAAGQRMDQLVHGLLDFAHLGRQELHKVQIDLDAAVSQIVAEMRSADPGRAVDVRLSPLPQGHGDPVLIRQALTNLLGACRAFPTIPSEC